MSGSPEILTYKATTANEHDHLGHFPILDFATLSNMMGTATTDSYSQAIVYAPQKHENTTSYSLIHSDLSGRSNPHKNETLEIQVRPGSPSITARRPTSIVFKAPKSLWTTMKRIAKPLSVHGFGSRKEK